MSKAHRFPPSPRRVYVEDAEGNRSYFPTTLAADPCEHRSLPGATLANSGTCAACASRPRHTLAQRLIAQALAAMLLVWLAWHVAGGLADWAAELAHSLNRGAR
jgi:hypothetical protein